MSAPTTQTFFKLSFCFACADDSTVLAEEKIIVFNDFESIKYQSLNSNTHTLKKIFLDFFYRNLLSMQEISPHYFTPEKQADFMQKAAVVLDRTTIGEILFAFDDIFLVAHKIYSTTLHFDLTQIDLDDVIILG